MNTLESIFQQNNIDIITYHIISPISDIIDIDYYQSNIILHHNILYISDQFIYEDTGIFIYNDDPHIDYQNYVVTYGNLQYIYQTLHHYFLENNVFQHNQNIILSQLVTGGGIKQIVSICARLMNHPIIVTNTAYKVLAMEDNGVEVNDPVWIKSLQYGYCDSLSIYKFENEDVTRKVLESNVPFILDTGLASDIPRVLSKVTIDDVVVAYIGVYLMDRSYNKDDFDTIELLCTMIKNEIFKDKSYMNTTNIIYELLIKELLNDKIDNMMVLDERLKSSKWQVKKIFRCSVISSSNNIRVNNASYLIDCLVSRYNVKTIIHDQNIVVINNYDNQQQWSEQIQYMNHECQSLYYKIGISDEFDSLFYLKKYYQEAKETLDIALTINTKDTHLYFSNLLPYVLFHHSSQEVLSLCHNTYYQKLYDYDMTHHTDYCDTLYYYVLYNTNINETSKKLCIHRNSLAHRMQRIQEITDIPLSNGIALQNYVLYYQIQYYLKAINKG
ncbi:MAG: helix-turn-helix domain-containing protein [Erysipelotrichaceae bacterium]|nr:helix-turn-helix domain-containing protein [Erysipelotrichaceae bacterium]